MQFSRQLYVFAKYCWFKQDAMWQIKAVDSKWNVIPKRSLQSTKNWRACMDEHNERLNELANALEILETGNSLNQRISILYATIHDTEHGVVDSDTTSRALLLRPLLHSMMSRILGVRSGNAVPARTFTCCVFP